MGVATRTLSFGNQESSLSGLAGRDRDATAIPVAFVQPRDLEARLWEFSRELFVDPALPRTAATIAHEYRRLINADRVWVLRSSGRGYRVEAVSGVAGFQRRAEVVRRIEELARLLCQSRQAFHWMAGAPLPIPARLEGAFSSYLDESHVAQLNVEPIFGNQQSRDDEASHRPDGAIAVVISESFQPQEAIVGESLRSAALVQVGLALENAADWSAAPLALALRRWRRKLSARQCAGWVLTLAAVCSVAVAGACYPMNDTIEAVGELQPMHQRHVFATATGVIKQLQIQTGDQLSAGDPLLTLEDAELELEFRRVEGELQATRQRVASLEASRLDHGSVSSESSIQMNSLAGELSEQLQRRTNLLQESELLAVRRKQLQIASPIAGQVVTWDIERLLARRPVIRGQKLLTIADTSGPWQIELRVADEDTHDLTRALRNNESVKIDYIIVTMPGVVRSAELKSVSDTVELRSACEGPTALCRAEVTDEGQRFATTGLGIRGRIHCGRKAAILVGMGKLWRTIQEHLLFPWGF